MNPVRQTKYTKEVALIIQRLGHASNAQIAKQLRHDYPTVSDTTVHRITSRLLERGVIAVAPSMSDGSTRYDGNIAEHDHFVCVDCDRVRDIDVMDALRDRLCMNMQDCKIDGRLVINGHCNKC